MILMAFDTIKINLVFVVAEDFCIAIGKNNKSVLSELFCSVFTIFVSRCNIIVKLPGKVDRQLCDNWLLSSQQHVFSGKAILNHLTLVYL